MSVLSRKRRSWSRCGFSHENVHCLRAGTVIITGHLPVKDLVASVCNVSLGIVVHSNELVSKGLQGSYLFLLRVNRRRGQSGLTKPVRLTVLTEDSYTLGDGANWEQDRNTSTL